MVVIFIRGQRKTELSKDEDKGCSGSLFLTLFARGSSSQENGQGLNQSVSQNYQNLELLEIRRHLAPYPIVLADAPTSALLARAPYPSVLADGLGFRV